MNIKTEVVNVDSEFAAHYLSRNDTNRPIIEFRFHSYASQMTDRLWEMNGEPIIISSEDTLLDGQHRLLAIIKCGLKVDILVVTGINKKFFKTIDTGDKRSASDVLSIQTGLPKSVADTLATCIKKDLMMAATGSVGKSPLVNRLLTPQVVSLAASTDPGYLNAVRFILDNKSGAAPMSYGMLAFLLFRFRKIKPDHDNDSWMKGFLTCAGLEEGDHRLYIRNRIYRESVRQTKTNIMVKAGFLIKAWRYHYLNKNLGSDNLFRDAMSNYQYIYCDSDKSKVKRLGEDNKINLAPLKQ